MALVKATAASLDAVLLWGLAATGVMSIMLEGSRVLGFSRMSLPFLFGTAFTDNRERASVLGFALYLVGGCVFAVSYAMAFTSLGLATWWLGGLLGLVHGLFLIVVFLPLLPNLHPRMATETSGPTSKRRLEPPGFLGLNYGRRTPLITLLGQVTYGVILGAFLPLGH